MKQYLLLDIDGVLNTSLGYIDENKIITLYNMVKVIKSVTGKDLDIILSSNWRFNINNINYINQRFLPYGLKIKDKTPLSMSTTLQQNRIQTIKAWSENHKNDKWVAIDDLHCESLGNDHFVWIDPKYGLMDYHIPKIVNLYL